MKDNAGGASALRSLAVSALVLFTLLGLLDLAVSRAFPRFDRLSDNFSAAYLRREVGALARERRGIVFLGDSVFWGYRLSAGQSAVSVLRRKGVPTRNLSFEGGSPANTYAMLRLLESQGIHPSRVVFNVNQKEFDTADSAYQTLHPSLEKLAAPLLTSAELADLKSARPHRTFEDRLDDAISARWQLYALRSDIREAVFSNVDASHALDDVVQTLSGAKRRLESAHRPTADRFEGTYDLSPLDSQNVSVRFLRRLAGLLRKLRIPAVAILTPTNHALLHEYIDAPEYDKNLAYVRAILEQNGVRVIDLDRRFSPDEFVDNDHLTAAGNQHLAEILEPELAR